MEKISELVKENGRLKQRIFELEEEVGKLEGSRDSARSCPASPKVMELLRQKDQTVERYTQELEEKNTRLESVVTELKTKNEELQNWVAAQRLYRAIFDSEPAAMLGVDKDGRIMAFNASAIRRFGEGLRFLQFEPIESLPSTAIGSVPVVDMIRNVLGDFQRREASYADKAGDHQVVAYPLGQPPEIRGVILRA